MQSTALQKRALHHFVLFGLHQKTNSTVSFSKATLIGSEAVKPLTIHRPVIAVSKGGFKMGTLKPLVCMKCTRNAIMRLAAGSVFDLTRTR